MGMFSFLTGKKHEAEVAPAPAPAPAGTDIVEAPSPTVQAQTPFHAPDAWQSEALASPKPETKHDALQVGPLDPEQMAALQVKIIEVIKMLYNPVIPVDIYVLALNYDII